MYANEAPDEVRAHAAYTECIWARPSDGLLTPAGSASAGDDCSDVVRLYTLAAHYGGNNDTATFCGEIVHLRESSQIQIPGLSSTELCAARFWDPGR